LWDKPRLIMLAADMATIEQSEEYFRSRERDDRKPTDGVSLYAFFAVLVNWHYSRVETSVSGSGSMTTSYQFDGGALIAVVCAVALSFLLRSIYRQVRGLLAEGPVVPRGLSLWVWWPSVYALLFFFRIDSGHSSSAGGETITTAMGYGSNMPGTAAVLFVLWMIAYQIRFNLRRFAGLK